MKLDSRNGVPFITPETPIEAKALNYMIRNRPLISALEKPILAAYEAGYNQALADGVNREIKIQVNGETA